MTISSPTTNRGSFRSLSNRPLLQMRTQSQAIKGCVSICIESRPPSVVYTRRPAAPLRSSSSQYHLCPRFVWFWPLSLHPWPFLTIDLLHILYKLWVVILSNLKPCCYYFVMDAILDNIFASVLFLLYIIDLNYANFTALFIPLKCLFYSLYRIGVNSRICLRKYMLRYSYIITFVLSRFCVRIVQIIYLSETKW